MIQYHTVQYNTILYLHRSYPGIRLLYPPHVGLADTEDWSCHHLACWTATCPRDVITRKTVDSIMSFPDQTSSSSRPDIIKRPDIMIWPEIITRKTLDSIMPGQKSSCMNWIKAVNGQLHWFHCVPSESHCANGPGKSWIQPSFYIILVPLPRGFTKAYVDTGQCGTYKHMLRERDGKSKIPGFWEFESGIPGTCRKLEFMLTPDKTSWIWFAALY